MTKAEYAAKKGITVEKLNRESMAFLQCEGYDDNGNEYKTLDDWLNRRPVEETYDIVDGGRGAGMFGLLD